MKNKIFSYLLLVIFSFASLATNSTLSSNSTLSNSEMSKLKGGDGSCPPWAALLFASGMAAAILCTDPIGILIYFSLFGICVGNLDGDPSDNGGGGGGGDNCCPNGGSPYEMGACQQEGGRVMSSNGCSGGAMNICCEY